MRLWSLHPMYFDYRDLHKLWRHGMIGLHCLTGNAAKYELRYMNHGQLERFKAQPDPVRALSDYMHALADVAEAREYALPVFFNRSTLPYKSPKGTKMTVTAGQMEAEVWRYADLLGRRRGMIEQYVEFFGTPQHKPHPIFELVRGPVAEWERFK